MPRLLGFRLAMPKAHQFLFFSMRTMCSRPTACELPMLLGRRPAGGNELEPRRRRGPWQAAICQSTALLLLARTMTSLCLYPAAAGVAG